MNKRKVGSMFDFFVFDSHVKVCVYEMVSAGLASQLADQHVENVSRAIFMDIYHNFPPVFSTEFIC